LATLTQVLRRFSFSMLWATFSRMKPSPPVMSASSVRRVVPIVFFMALSATRQLRGFAQSRARASPMESLTTISRSAYQSPRHSPCSLLDYWGYAFAALVTAATPNKPRHDNPYQPPCFDDFPQFQPQPRDRRAPPLVVVHALYVRQQYHVIRVPHRDNHGETGLCDFTIKSRDVKRGTMGV